MRTKDLRRVLVLPMPLKECTHIRLTQYFRMPDAVGVRFQGGTLEQVEREVEPPVMGLAHEDDTELTVIEPAVTVTETWFVRDFAIDEMTVAMTGGQYAQFCAHREAEGDPVDPEMGVMFTDRAAVQMLWLKFLTDRNLLPPGM
jgi:hypothetical protein